MPPVSAQRYFFPQRTIFTAGKLSRYCSHPLLGREAVPRLCHSPTVSLLISLALAPPSPVITLLRLPRRSTAPTGQGLSLPVCAERVSHAGAGAGEGPRTLPVTKNEVRLCWEASRWSEAAGIARGSGEVG